MSRRCCLTVPQVPNRCKITKTGVGGILRALISAGVVMLRPYKVKFFNAGRSSLRMFSAALMLCLGLSMAIPCAQADDSGHVQGEHSQKKTAKKQPAPLPPLPSGPTGPVPQLPLDSTSPVPPQVTYKDGLLTIVAPNSTLGDILRAVREQTKAEIEVPIANDRVVTRLGPGPVQQVMSDLLNGSRFNYVLMGSADNPDALTRVVLVAKPKADMPAAAAQQQAANQPPHAGVTVDPDSQQTDDDSADNSNDQPAEPEPQPAPAQDDQQGGKTPQQMLQEMQQRQLQFQQQQQQLQQQQQQSGQQPANPPTSPPPQDR
jgi:hypothetical protein